MTEGAVPGSDARALAQISVVEVGASAAHLVARDTRAAPDLTTTQRRGAALALSQAIAAGDLPRARSSLDSLDSILCSTGGGLSVSELKIISGVIDLISAELSDLEANEASA
jgi:hypothetical protein